MAEPVTVGLLVRTEALPGRESGVENFLQQELGIVEQEPNTVRRFATRFGPSSFGPSIEPVDVIAEKPPI